MKPLLLALVVLLFPGIALAHGDTPFLEEVVNGHLVDIGYTSGTPSSGEAVLFDFSLLEPTSRERIPFSYVWVKVQNAEDTVVLATGIHNARFGGPRLSYVFPAEGKYTVSARYEDEEGTLAEVSLPFTVRGEEDHALYLSGAAGLVLGALGAFWVLRRKRM